MRIKAEGAGLGTAIIYALAVVVSIWVCLTHWPDQTVDDLMSFLSGAALVFGLVCFDRMVWACGFAEEDD